MIRSNASNFPLLFFFIKWMAIQDQEIENMIICFEFFFLFFFFVVIRKGYSKVVFDCSIFLLVAFIICEIIHYLWIDKCRLCSTIWAAMTLNSNQPDGVLDFKNEFNSSLNGRNVYFKVKPPHTIMRETTALKRHFLLKKGRLCLQILHLLSRHT